MRRHTHAHYAVQSYEIPAIWHSAKRMFLLDLQTARTGGEYAGKNSADAVIIPQVVCHKGADTIDCMNDLQIVEHILNHREKRLFAVLVAKYSGVVLSKALAIVRDRELAAEISQQTFIKAYTNLGSWGGGESLAPWLTVIASHLAINLLDKIKRRNSAPLTDDVAEEEDFSEEHEEKLARLREAVKLLPTKEREIIRLHYYENMKTGEIAEKLKLSPSNVLVKLHRIREKLKEQLKSRENER